MSKKWVTLFLTLDCSSLFKDPGLIPYYINQHEEWYTENAVYSDSDVFNLSNNKEENTFYAVKRWTGNETIDGLIYIKKKYREIDVLNLFHFSLGNLLIALFYKQLRRDGFVYLKLDIDAIALKRKKIRYLNLKNPLSMLYKRIANKIDLFSAETSDIAEIFRKEYFSQTLYVPNGVYRKREKFSKFSEKNQNQLLSIARFGTPQKKTEVLLQAWTIIHHKLPSVKLHLVGTVEKEFTESFLKEYQKTNIDAWNNIVWHGEITDKQNLEKIIDESSVFLFSSIRESFGLVYVEALAGGNVIISTDIPAAMDILSRNGVGHLAPVGDYEALANETIKVFQQIENNSIQILNEQQKGVSIANSEYNWKTIVDRLLLTIEKKRQDK